MADLEADTKDFINVVRDVIVEGHWDGYDPEGPPGNTFLKEK